MIQNVKFQKRKGKTGIKHAIQYNGRNYYYENTKDLAAKLHVSVKQALYLIKHDNGRRIVQDEDNETMLMNIKTENFSKLLRQKFGVKRINNKTILEDDIYIPSKDIGISNKLPKNNEVTVNILIKYTIGFYSGDELIETSERTELSIFKGRIRDIPNHVLQKVENFKKKYIDIGTLIKYTYTVRDSIRQRKLIFENNNLRDFNDVYELTEWANIEYEKNNYENNCVVNLISKRYPKLQYEITTYETLHGITIGNFMHFCEKYDIGYSLYDEQGKITRNIDGTNGNIVCMIYNNHIYSINGGKPRRYSSKEYKIKYIAEPLKKIEELIDNKKKLPANIKIQSLVTLKKFDKMDNIGDISFVVKDTKYIYNPEHEECLNILTKMGYEMYICDNIKLASIPVILEKILKPADNAISFIPELDSFKSKALLWKSDEEIDMQKIVTIDKNKCYPYELYNLPYLIKFDYRKNNINSQFFLDPEKIIETNLYIAKPKFWSILIPETNIYWGKYLHECKKIGIKFELVEELETEIVPNYFRQIIRLMYKHMDMKSFSHAMNIYIGKMERSFEMKYQYDYVTICNKETARTQEGFFRKIGSHYLVYKERTQYSGVKSRFPIATQIKNMARFHIYEKIEELHIPHINIKQINTDSISYYGVLPKDLDPKDFNGWKSTSFKKIRDEQEHCNRDLSVIKIPNMNTKTRILHTTYAGSGKTYRIINDIIPRLKKQKISYIVLTPTCETVSEFKRNGIDKCETIQKYVNTNTIPKEEYIIIDEIGFIDSSAHNFLYAINKANKSFECFGDFKQLLPVGEKLSLNQEHYLNYLFNDIDTDFTNHRNNFTIEYYDKLINHEIDLPKEVSKWSTKKPWDAEYILCYRHKIKERYNNLMINKIGLNSWLDKGAMVICTTAKLIKNNIYRNKKFIIESTCNDTNSDYIIKDNLANIFFLSASKIERNFEPCYAINIHQAQGTTLESYYWAKEDDRFLDGRTAYTVISRLKQ